MATSNARVMACSYHFCDATTSPVLHRAPMVSWVAGFLLLAAGVVSLALSANALFPRRGARALLVSFAASMITLELAAHQLVVQIGGALVFVALGALATRPGQIGLV